MEASAGSLRGHKQYAVHAVAMTRLAATQHKIASAMLSMGTLPCRRPVERLNDSLETCHRGSTSSACARLFHSRECVLGPAHRRRLFDLDPVARRASPVAAISALRNQTLQHHVAGSREKVRPDPALLEGRQVDAVSTTGEEAGEVSLAQVQGKLPQIIAIKGEDVEGVKLGFIVLCLPP
jgi:hypothetical protein